MSFVIRPALPEDSDAAVRVVREVFDEYGFTWDEDDYNADLHDLKTYYLDLGDPFWVAELSGKREIVGTCALEYFPKLSGSLGGLTTYEGKARVAAADCSLERLYVRPSARRMGLGRALLLQAVRTALENKRSVMEIWSDKKLTTAHAVYQKYGAVLVGDRILDDPDESPEWGMALAIDRGLVDRLANQ